MGKGDIKTRRGKIFNGSFGVSRKRTKDSNVPRKFLSGVSTSGSGDADEAFKEAKKAASKDAKPKKADVKKSSSKKTTAKKVPDEMKAVAKKSTTAKKAAPKK